MQNAVSLFAQLDPASVLFLGAVLLACGSVGLLVVRRNNPRLKGLAWLGYAFISGGVGALLLMFASHLPRLVSSVASDFMILLAVVLLHVGVLEIRQAESLVPRTGVVLLAVLVSAFLGVHFVHPVAGLRVVLLGILVAIQLIQTVVTLVRGTKQETRAPAWCMATCLLLLIATNVTRSLLLVFEKTRMGDTGVDALQTLTYVVYIVTAMGLGFGFFWTTSAELTNELDHMANTDPLTRIFNRRIFRRWCEREMELSHRTGNVFSMLMVDLDHFKKVNDRFGHQFGDRILCAAVERMQDAVRGIDVLGRWGGEEFVVMLPGASAESAMIVAERLRANVERLRVATDATAKQLSELVAVTVSVGVTSYTGATDHLEAMFQRTDVALYRAKSSGRNRVVAVWQEASERPGLVEELAEESCQVQTV